MGMIILDRGANGKYMYSLRFGHLAFLGVLILVFACYLEVQVSGPACGAATSSSWDFSKQSILGLINHQHTISCSKLKLEGASRMSFSVFEGSINGEYE